MKIYLRKGKKLVKFNTLSQIIHKYKIKTNYEEEQGYKELNNLEKQINEYLNRGYAFITNRDEIHTRILDLHKLNVNVRKINTIIIAAFDAHLGACYIQEVIEGTR